eukprot:evm.model.scf_2174.3 EVM.evm.TU.scf_2174.3   scf_2174:25411-26479(+)
MCSHAGKGYSPYGPPPPQGPTNGSVEATNLDDAAKASNKQAEPTPGEKRVPENVDDAALPDSQQGEALRKDGPPPRKTRARENVNDAALVDNERGEALRKGYTLVDIFREAMDSPEPQWRQPMPPRSLNLQPNIAQKLVQEVDDKTAVPRASGNHMCGVEERDALPWSLDTEDYYALTWTPSPPETPSDIGWGNDMGWGNVLLVPSDSESSEPRWLY